MAAQLKRWALGQLSINCVALVNLICVSIFLTCKDLCKKEKLHGSATHGT